MESPAVLAFLAFYASGAHAFDPAPIAMASIWLCHYVYRTFIFPFRLRSNRPMPVSIVLAGFSFNLANAYTNGHQLAAVGDYSGWLSGARFFIGLALFGVGWGVNLHSDHVLLRLRAPGESGYRIPHGGLYRWLSCPNYLGEMTEWLGWAILTWSGAGLAFFLFTSANLIPRAIAHHAWYQKTFADYPPRRKAILPGLL
jgi:protein-S-isoprenylcysteine O-methyltransferase Ste14